MTESYNPLDMANLADSIVTRMESRDAVPLASMERFAGAGVYAIYYRGEFPAYTALTAENASSWAVPIYVGKAVPPGARRGLNDSTANTALHGRLSNHRASITAATNLDLEDFAVRWLVVDDIWIPLGESAMIRRYKPVWNSAVDGFGNNTPGAKRETGQRSQWDTLHPGRTWADRATPRAETVPQLTFAVQEHLRSRLS